MSPPFQTPTQPPYTVLLKAKKMGVQKWNGPQQHDGNTCKWADKFCLHCNILSYIRHIWIKLVLCSRMVSLFQHTSLWTHRCLQSSPSAHRNGRVFRHSIQTSCCYWILNRGKSSSNWNSQMNESHYGDQCVDVSTVRRWWSVCWCEYSKTLVISVLMWVQ